MAKAIHFVCNICGIALLLACTTANAQVKKQPQKKQLLANLDKKETPTTIIKEANVVFPEILCGNEEQSLDYVEKFSATEGII
ncbi:MAG: hypothetical protein WDM90_15240 [Ferruginibacter sp.]